MGQLEQLCYRYHRFQGHTAGSMQLALLALPAAVAALQPLNGIGVKPLGGAASIDVGALLDKKAAVIFGTYAAGRAQCINQIGATRAES